MNLHEWNKSQIEEALGSTNRYYFWLKHQREPVSSNELIIYYIENGGAVGFAKRAKEENVSSRDER